MCHTDRRIKAVARAQVNAVKARVAAVFCEVDNDDDRWPRRSAKGAKIAAIFGQGAGQQGAFKPLDGDSRAGCIIAIADRAL